MTRPWRVVRVIQHPYYYLVQRWLDGAWVTVRRNDSLGFVQGWLDGHGVPPGDVEWLEQDGEG